jgi:hypothetical protein
MVVLAALVKKERIKAGLPEGVASMEPLRDVIGTCCFLSSSCLHSH